MNHKHTTKTGLMLGVLASIAAGCCYSEVVAYDGFSVPLIYSSRRPLNGLAGGTGFAGPWSVDTSDGASNVRRYLASSSAPTYVDTKGKSLETQPGSMIVMSQGEGQGPLMRELKQEMKGTIWISFLTKMDDQLGYGWDIQFSDTEGAMQVKLMNGKQENNRWRIQSFKTETGKAKDGLFKSKQGMTPTDPMLVILKIDHAGSGEADGSITAYLNPTDLRDAEISAMESVKISGLQLNAIKNFRFDKKSAATGYIDELRFGTSLEDVLPLQ